MSSGRESEAQPTHMTTTTLKVEGMTCGACTSAVESGLSGVRGVGSVSVSLIMERAVVMHNVEKISADQVKEIIEDRGFDAEVLNSDGPRRTQSEHRWETEGEEAMENGDRRSAKTATTLHIGGMTCGACTSAVEGAFENLPGVASFNISLLSERAVIEHDAGIISPGKLVEVVEDTGFDAEILQTKHLRSTRPRSRSPRHGGRTKLVTTTVSIEGMTCGACTSAVEAGFQNVEGIEQFNISLLAERAVVLHHAEVSPAARIVATIEDRGFDAKLVSSLEEGEAASTLHSTVLFRLYGLASPEAADELQSTLANIPGMRSVQIDFPTLRATITHTPSKIGVRAIVDAIEKAGLNALVADSDDNNAQLESLAKTKEIQNWYRAFKISLTFAIPVFIISMLLPMFIPALDFGSVQLPVPGLWLGDVICLILTIPVQFGIGRRFYISAWKSIKHGSPTMDVLVTLGTSAAFFFSCAAMGVSIVRRPHSRPATTFDTSTMLITFITLGRYLENRAKGQTSRALSRLMNLAPSAATIYSDPIAAVKAAEEWDKPDTVSTDEKLATRPLAVSLEERTVPTELIEVGDIVIIKPGDKIPADGLVTRGQSYVDESMVTGEAMPILKKPNAALLAGTVNGSGRLDFKVTRAGRDTQLSQIVRLVQEAQTSRAPIQRMADVVAGYFVPIIITLGIVTFVGWMVLSHLLPHPPRVFLADASGGRVMVCVKLCIAVVVFACPCALGLATPTAVMVGTGVGAEQGILFKGGAILEMATRIKRVVFDKTGTLTMGKMSVSQTQLTKEWSQTSESRELWWTLLGLAEAESEHPIARAVVAGAKKHLGIDLNATIGGTTGDFKSTVGKGISASVEPVNSPGKRYRILVGNQSFLRDQSVMVAEASEDCGTEIDASASELSQVPGHSNRPNASESAGTTTIHFAIDDLYAGSVGLSDLLKPSARACISALHKMKIATSLVTGDQASSAHHVAALVGISAEDVHAGVLPQGKQAIVEDLQSGGQIVAMVGDGINDSPALATANIGISLASGTDVAVEAADVVLMKPNQLMDIPASLHLSKTIFRRIKLNLLLSCVYNIVGLPIAMGFLLPWGIQLPPMAAGAAMACSSVTVVVSSLLLRLWQRPRWMHDGPSEGPVEKKPGLWDSVKAYKDVLVGRRTVDKGERGEYFPLGNYERV